MLLFPVSITVAFYSSSSLPTRGSSDLLKHREWDPLSRATPCSWAIPEWSYTRLSQIHRGCWAHSIPGYIHNVMKMVTPNNKTLTFPHTPSLVSLLASLRIPALFPVFLRSIHPFLQNTQYPTHVNRFTADQSWVQSNQTSKPLKVKVQKPLLTWKFN